MVKTTFGLVLIFVVQIYPISKAFGQEVEHNYKVGPQQTTCDSLDLDNRDAAESMKIIRNTKFRFQQSFRLTRRQGFKGGEFYSCDNKKGYLVVKMDDQEMLYKNVELKIWEELISSSDPEGYYLKHKAILITY